MEPKKRKPLSNILGEALVIVAFLCIIALLIGITIAILCRLF